MYCAPAVSLWWHVGWTSRHSLLGLPSRKTGSMSCQQVPTTPAFNLYPRSVQVGEFEVAIDGGIWVAIRAMAPPVSKTSGAYASKKNHHSNSFHGWYIGVPRRSNKGEPRRT